MSNIIDMPCGCRVDLGAAAGREISHQCDYHQGRDEGVNAAEAHLAAYSLDDLRAYQRQALIDIAIAMRVGK